MTHAVVRRARAGAAVLTTMPDNAVSMAWKFLGLQDGGTKIDVAYVAGDGSCVSPAGFAVDQSTDTVTVEAVSTHDPSQQACPDVLGEGRALVTLPTPVGPGSGTALEHAAVDGKSGFPSVFPE